MPRGGEGDGDLGCHYMEAIKRYCCLVAIWTFASDDDVSDFCTCLSAWIKVKNDWNPKPCIHLKIVIIDPPRISEALQR